MILKELIDSVLKKYSEFYQYYLSPKCKEELIKEIKKFYVSREDITTIKENTYCICKNSVKIINMQSYDCLTGKMTYLPDYCLTCGKLLNPEYRRKNYDKK